MKENKPFRRLPQQTRSYQRFNQIVDAAAQVFEEVGYEAASTELIAERANTSIGSLYRFFPDKAAIAYALAERYAEQMKSLFATYFNSSTVLYSLEEVVSETVNAFDKFYTSQPGCREIMLQSLISPDIQAVNKQADNQIIEQLDNFFALRNPTLDPDRRRLATLVTLEITNALQLWSLQESDEFREQIITETKFVLIRYLTPLFGDINDAKN
ncbi:TetR/AcrR family transcriptional regulator [Baaleninema simplex]|uniref:TetR/AcrR family transcriptional regulator n=1 Tax=Baaleninema simplex TaxID=2862350 RepID=UPI000347DEA6|nr:TetR/AcrR family transcriptional regulator [Baaleninema simplex]